MNIGLPKEVKPNEYRVALSPTAVGELTRRGHAVWVEHDAGAGSGFADSEYEKAGATIADCDTVFDKGELICKVKEVFPQEYKYLKSDKILFTYIHSNAHLDQTEALMKSGIASLAYEDVTDKNGKFPLLKPMSELAGKGGFLAALHLSQAVHGGAGKLLANICGVETPVVTVIGCGCSGLGAAELAASFGNEVRMLDISVEAMESARDKLPPNVTTLFSNRGNLLKCIKESDVIINCILWPKTRKDHLISREDLALMKPGALIIDVACDEDGAVETCRSTSHDDPTYVVDGITHYCVDNIPSAFSNTASTMLCNVTLPFVLALANKGVRQAVKDDPYLRRGLTTFEGKLTLEETALKLNLPYTSADELVETF